MPIWNCAFVLVYSCTLTVFFLLLFPKRAFVVILCFSDFWSQIFDYQSFFLLPGTKSIYSFWFIQISCILCMLGLLVCISGHLLVSSLPLVFLSLLHTFNCSDLHCHPVFFCTCKTTIFLLLEIIYLSFVHVYLVD